MEKKKFGKLKIMFVVLFIAAALTPAALMPIFGNQKGESKDAETQLPPLVVDGKLNEQFFLDSDGKFDNEFAEKTGDYFSKKFAFRREMVDTRNRLLGKVFGISGESNVIMGENGYLFYASSLDDYLGRNQMSDYEISSLGQNILIMQKQLEQKGIDFLFTISPNKNSLYPKLMPAKYMPDKDYRNSERLVPLIEELGVNYLDIYSIFRRMEDRVMYLKGDSHWNNEGAAIVAKALLTKLPHGATDYSKAKYKEVDDFNGDLYAMIYPWKKVTEKQIYYENMEPEAYNKRVSVSVFNDETFLMEKVDPRKVTDWSHNAMIETESKKGSGSLLMIRDSFGNSLAPFIANEFKSASFLNGDPYNIGSAVADKRDAVLFEIVERNLYRMMKDAPVISSEPVLSKKEADYLGSGKFMKTSQERGYTGMLACELTNKGLHVTGDLDPARISDDARIFVRFREKKTGEHKLFSLYRVWRENHRSRDKAYGAACYIDEASLKDGDYNLELIYKANGKWHRTAALGEYLKKPRE